ncbi:MAG: cytidine deaminase [Elusimicrobiota bacterium]
MTLNKTYRKLIETAKRARRKAYCPYSRYAIGSAVLTESGQIFSGANVENASYGLSLCGERVAIFNAISRGAKWLKAICVVGRSARPCGACRQVMLEFSSKETDLICVDLKTETGRDSITVTKMFKSLPHSFDPLDAGLLPTNPQNLLKRSKARSQEKQKRRSARKARSAAPRRKKRRTVGKKRAARKRGR